MANKDDTKPNLVDLIRAMADDHLGKEEFQKAFDLVIAHVKESDTKTSEAVKLIADSLIAKSEELRNSNASEFGSHKEEARALVSAALLDLTSRVDEKIAAVDAAVANIRDGIDGVDADEDAVKEAVLAELKTPAYREVVTDDPATIRNKLEVLQGDERLDASAIKGLDERFTKLENAPKQINGGIIGRDFIKDYDLSDQLDGSTKTFNLPAVWNIVSVDLSSFPHALRKGTDFTWTPQSITFTDEIDAATSLAAGQTCVLTIVT